MKTILLGTVTLIIMAASAQAGISNKKCVAGLKVAQSGFKYQAFAMIPGGAHCNWTIHSHSSQTKANRLVMDNCKRSNPGQGCFIAWPNR